MSREPEESITTPLAGPRDLLAVFTGGARPRKDFVLGLEIEFLLVNPRTGAAAPFDGPRGIEAVVRALASRFGWETVLNGTRVIGLARGDSAVTLEPGGQVEISTRTHPDLDSLDREVSAFVRELLDVAAGLDLAVLPLGLHPVTEASGIGWVPKYRYDVMRAYYAGRPGLALEMMGRTASIQVNLDYDSEEDARKKVKLGALLTPVVGAMFANSAVEGGRLNGYCTRRLLVWRETDPDRTGIPAFFVDGTFSFERYADYALDVPMYFVARDGLHRPAGGRTFRRFLEEGWEGTPATQGDWILHLTTLFPDVRLKNHLEFRSADAQPPKLALALTAFWIGLCHDGTALDAALDLLAPIGRKEILEAISEAAYFGLSGRFGRRTLLETAREIGSIASVGLSRLDRASGRSDLRYLDPLRDLLEQGSSPAEQLRESFKGDVKQLIHSFRLA